MRINRIPNETTKEETNAIDFNPLDNIIIKYQHKKGNLIPILQGAQETYGYISSETFEYISQKANIPLSKLYGVATFYAQFRLYPVGKYVIKVCHGTACHVQNADKITEALMDDLGVKDGQTTEDGLFTLESVACLGCCSLAPVMMIGDETFGKLTGKEAVNIVKNIKIQEKA